MFPVVLLVLVFLAYMPAMNGWFVWDDDWWSTRISDLTKDSAGLLRMWTDTQALQQYYPLTGTTFWWDFQRWGYWTPAWHIENVLLHVAAAILFWRVLLQWKVRGAWIAATLFALHPMMVESVAWITERKNVLSQAIVLGSVLAYGRFAGWNELSKVRTASRWGWYGLALVLFIAAMLAKVSVLVVMPGLLLVAWWKHDRLDLRRDVVPLIPFFLSAVILGSIVMKLEQHHVGAETLHTNLHFLDRVLIASRALWFYIGKLLVPANLCFVYPTWDIRSWVTWMWTPVTLLALAALWRWRNRLGKGVWVALAFYVGALMPVLGFVNVYGQKFSWVWDHWVYLPALSFFALAGVGLSHLVEKVKTPSVRWLVVVGFTIGLACLSGKEALKYEGESTLWKVTLASNPQCSLAYHNLGNAYQRDGRLSEAMALYTHALQIQPDLPQTHLNLGSCWMTLGDHEKAAKCYLQVLASIPHDLLAHNNLGSCYLGMNKPLEALPHFLEVAESHPNVAKANSNIGICYQAAGKVGMAIKSYQRALELDENSPMALLRLGWIRAASPDDNVRDATVALQLAERAQRVIPTAAMEEALIIAAAHAEQGHFKEALNEIDKAEKILGDRPGGKLQEMMSQQLLNYANGLTYFDPMLIEGAAHDPGLKL